MSAHHWAVKNCCGFLLRILIEHTPHTTSEYPKWASFLNWTAPQTMYWIFHHYNPIPKPYITIYKGTCYAYSGVRMRAHEHIHIHTWRQNVIRKSSTLALKFDSKNLPISVTGHKYRTMWPYSHYSKKMCVIQINICGNCHMPASLLAWLLACWLSVPGPIFIDKLKPLRALIIIWNELKIHEGKKRKRTTEIELFFFFFCCEMMAQTNNAISRKASCPWLRTKHHFVLFFSFFSLSSNIETQT